MGEPPADEDIEEQLARAQGQECELVSASKPTWAGLKASAEERTRLTGARSHAFSGPVAGCSWLDAPQPSRLHGERATAGDWKCPSMPMRGAESPTHAQGFPGKRMHVPRALPWRWLLLRSLPPLSSRGQSRP